MPSLNRRAFLAASSAALLATSGCTALDSSPMPAHWVTVYLVDTGEPRNVTVAVNDDSGATLFKKDYRLSESNEADEDALFPESTNPETVVVTVDGTRFKRNWPGFEQREIPCNGQNYSGIALWIENGQNGSPEIRLEADCQHVTMG